MEVYVTGKKMANNVEVLCYKMDSFEIDKKTKIIVSKGYRALVYMDNKYYDTLVFILIHEPSADNPGNLSE